MKAMSGLYINNSYLLDKAFQSYLFGRKKDFEIFLNIFYLTNEKFDECKAQWCIQQKNHLVEMGYLLLLLLLRLLLLLLSEVL